SQYACIIDICYFKSVYLRDSHGIVFIIATEEPGFAVDGADEHLGEKLDLPPFLEDQRAEIEANLAPIEEK
ncbi:ring-cleaving dioxygenase, partial [Klebsiella pneumoniae]